MMKAAVLAASLSLLTSCATRSLPPPVKEPSPVAADPRLCVPLEKAPAVVGSIVAPVTAEEREAVRQHLTSDAEVAAWGRRGWDRAAIALRACPS